MLKIIKPKQIRHWVKNNIHLVLIFLVAFNGFTQNHQEDYKRFDSLFFNISKSFVVDDISVKFSTNKEISYSLLKKILKDKDGKGRILIDSTKYHSFSALYKFRLSDSIMYYTISHKVKAGCSFYYYAYISVFKNDVLVQNRAIYSNSKSNFYDGNFGALFNKDKFYIFKNNIYIKFSIDKSTGIIYEEEKSDFVKNIINLEEIARSKSFKIKFDYNFYKSEKVLLPIFTICNTSIPQLLTDIDEKLTKIKSYFIDYSDNNYYYLNRLKTTYSDNFFELVFYEVKNNCKDLGYISKSEYIPISNEKYFIEEFTINTQLPHE